MSRIHFQEIALPRVNGKLTRAELKHAVSRIKSAGDLSVFSSAEVAPVLAGILDDVKAGRGVAAPVGSAMPHRSVVSKMIERAYAIGALQVSIGVGPEYLVEYHLLEGTWRDGPMPVEVVEEIQRYLAAGSDPSIGSMPVGETIDGIGVQAALSRDETGRHWISLRRLYREVPRLDHLGIADWERLWRAAQSENGLLLICGTSSSGKSTTLASLYDRFRDVGRPSKVASSHLMMKPPFYRMLAGKPRSDDWCDLNEIGGAGEAVFSEVRSDETSPGTLIPIAERSLLAMTCHASGPRIGLRTLRVLGFSDDWMLQNVCGILSQSIATDETGVRRFSAKFYGIEEIRTILGDMAPVTVNA